MGERLELVIAGNEPPPPPVTDNAFIPEDRELGECITAVPKPGCGSEARGDWHQGVVLALMVAGLVVIGWRIARGVRRRDPQPTDVHAP
jgi:hypothetical protein